MCGIAGIVSTSLDAGSLEVTAERMIGTLVHRGPDEGGVAVVPEAGVAIGMRRLSVLDLEGGHQPMWDADSSRCIVFNGEIYNHASLRAELIQRGARFRTDHSDTETILQGYAVWGVEVFRRLNGMFAIAIWDGKRRELVLARDRMGEKPLYVGRAGGDLVFGSELKALLVHPGLSREIDHVGLDQFFAFDYTLGEQTMLRAVRKLAPATFAVYRNGELVNSERFWEPDFTPLDLSEREAVEQLDALLDQSVRERMVADVPLGLFLSGGLDSSTIGYYMRRHSDNVHSFSIGFEESGYDEAPYAKSVARHLGIDHHLEVLSQQRAAEIIPRLADILDEPMADHSILPTHLLSTFARTQVTVALGGDGSDELLMGYSAYQGLRTAAVVDALPARLGRPARRALAAIPKRVGPVKLRGLDWLRGASGAPVPHVLTQIGDLRSWSSNSHALLRPELRSTLDPEPFTRASQYVLNGVDGVDWGGAATAAYIRGYLPDDILVKVDRASMAASLEVRAPFLDYDLVDFALRLPTGLKLKRLRAKHLLKEVMADRLPPEVVKRQKAGFNIPLSQWLASSLLPLVRDVLSKERLERGGLFDPSVVGGLIDRHASGERDHGNLIWHVLQFELWRERWLTPPASPANLA